MQIISYFLLLARANSVATELGLIFKRLAICSRDRPVSLRTTAWRSLKLNLSKPFISKCNATHPSLLYRYPISDIRYPWFVVPFHISNFVVRTSDLGPRTSDFGPRTSDFGLRASCIVHRASRSTYAHPVNKLCTKQLQDIYKSFTFLL